jgi:DNA-binding IclR family transcriptional regulator
MLFSFRNLNHCFGNVNIRLAPMKNAAHAAAAADQRVESVERALTILEAAAKQTEPATLAELAERTGLYKSTLLRLASSLERFGFLVRQEDGRFRLGPSLYTLGLHYLHHFNLEDYIRPELRRLVDATQETASFYVIEGDMRVCLCRLNSPRSARHHLEEGMRFPLGKGASGRILSAFSADAPQGAEAEIVRRGSYCSLGERDPHVAAVAVPILDRSDRLRGALSVSGLITRFDDKARKRALKALQQGAERLRAALPLEQR